jgi:hypothetical protein
MKAFKSCLHPIILIVLFLFPIISSAQEMNPNQLDPGNLLLDEDGDHWNVELVSSIDSLDGTKSIAISNGYAYIATEDTGIRIFDISDPSDPIEVGVYITESGPNKIVIEGNYAYTTDGMFGLLILDTSDPANLSEVGSIESGEFANNITISGNFVYIANDFTIVIIDVSDPAIPVLVSTNNINGMFRDIAVSGDYAYLADGDDGFRVVDVSDPQNISDVSSLYYDNVWAIAASGDYVYLGHQSGPQEEGLSVINVSDPNNPFEIGLCQLPGQQFGITVSGDYAFVADYDAGLRVINISDPANPVESGFYDTYGLAFSVTVSGNCAYLDDLFSVEIFDCSNAINDLLPDAFSLISPSNYATITDDSVELSWEESSEDVNEYVVWYARNREFTEELDSVLVVNTDCTLENLDDFTTYWWKVRAVDDDSPGRWSNQMWSFNINIDLVPFPFDLLTPIENTTINYDNVRLTWSGSSEDIITYVIWYAMDSEFTIGVDSVAVVDTSYVVRNLQDQATYWWKVRANNETSAGTWSNQTWSFDIDMSVFDLTSPYDNANVGCNDVELRWSEPLNNAYEYITWYAKDEEFTIGLDSMIVDINTCTLNNLEDQTTYWWKVRANSETSIGTWSNQTWSFNADISVSVDDENSDFPTEYAITNAYPNPFNPTLNVSISMPQTSKLKVSVFNVMGQSVAILSNGGQYSAGTHSFTFNGSDLGSGVYFVHASVVGKLNQVKKVVLMK